MFSTLLIKKNLPQIVIRDRYYVHRIVFMSNNTLSQKHRPILIFKEI